MEKLPNMNMLVLEPSRAKPKAGDLFVCNMRGERWVAGRVVHMDCRLLGGTPGLLGVFYFYRGDVSDPSAIRPPLAPDLLIPPIAAGAHCWREGLFRTVGNYALSPEERLPRHVFLHMDNRHYDEYFEPCPPPKPGEYVSDTGAYLPQGIDDLLSDALGIPRIPEVESEAIGDAAGLEPAENEVIICLPDMDGSINIRKIERPLEAALKKARLGEWEGHGYDLERQQWDIRFNGPDPARMSTALLPVLKKLKLPPGSSLLVGGKKAKRIDL